MLSSAIHLFDYKLADCCGSLFDYLYLASEYLHNRTTHNKSEQLCEMTLQDVFNEIGQNPTLVMGFFIGLPILTFVALLFSKGGSHDDSHDSPWKYFYSGIIYAACVPGIFALTLTVYTFLFEGKSLLNVNFFVYFLPIISMIITILILRTRLDLKRIPGFDQLSGLMMMIAAAFIGVLIIQKTRIWVIFHGSAWMLLGIFVALFLAFKIGWERMSSRRN